MLFPLLWYVDGLCTIKTVEMADKSLYAFKVRNSPHLLFFYKFGTKKQHTKQKMRFLGSQSSDCDRKAAVNHKSPWLIEPPA